MTLQQEVRTPGTLGCLTVWRNGVQAGNDKNFVMDRFFKNIIKEVCRYNLESHQKT